MRINKNCEKCGVEFQTYQSAFKKPKRFCSLKCRGMLGGRKKLTDEQKIESIKASFEKHVIKKDGCWGWNGRLFPNGYPVMTMLHKKGASTGHRASWIIHKGQIPESMVVCHKCDNKECTNIDHLFLGTHKQNSQDMVSKSRQAKGIKNGSAKLSESDVQDIKRCLNEGHTYKSLADKYSLTASTISHIKKGRLWKHIQG